MRFCSRKWMNGSARRPGITLKQEIRSSSSTSEALMRMLSPVFLCVILFAPDSAFSNADPFVGRWALTLPDGHAGWLGIEQHENGLSASLLWGSGSVLPVDEVSVTGQTLNISRTIKSGNSSSGHRLDRDMRRGCAQPDVNPGPRRRHGAPEQAVRKADRVDASPAGPGGGGIRQGDSSDPRRRPFRLEVGGERRGKRLDRQGRDPVKSSGS